MTKTGRCWTIEEAVNYQLLDILEWRLDLDGYFTGDNLVDLCGYVRILSELEGDE